jgi:hypothetical protein
MAQLLKVLGVKDYTVELYTPPSTRHPAHSGSEDEEYIQTGLE